MNSKDQVTGEIYRYGLYENVGEYYTENNSAVPSGKIGKTTGHARHVRQTDQIPLVFGVRFGYDFRIHGLPDDSVTLKCVVTHPPITRHDGKTQTRFEYETEFKVVDGIVENGASYYINHDYEMVAGTWTRSYYYEGKLILHKTFEVSSRYKIKPQDVTY